MTTTLIDSTLDVETDGRVLHGVLIPYNKRCLVGDHQRRPPGHLLRDLGPRQRHLAGRPIPLLIAHREHQPVGKVRTGALHHTDDGLHVEAILSGSASEIDGIVARARDNVMSGLSVGFLGNRDLDEWSAPDTPGGVPNVLRRGAVIREASVCVWPALEGAQVARVTARTAADTETYRFIAERRAELEAEATQRRIETEQLLAEVAHLGTRRAEPQPEPEPARIVIPPPTEFDGMVLASAPELLHPERASVQLRAEYERRLRWWAEDLVRLDDRRCHTPR